MLGFQSSTEHAKRLILEAPDNTRKTCFLLLATLLVISVHLVLSYLGTENSWTCELDNSKPEHLYICRELRKYASCRTLAGPLKAEIMLNVNDAVTASAYIVCPWENAVSELRLCFALGSVLCIMIGLMALAKEDRKLAEFHLNSSYFFCLLLGIAAFFDMYAVADSVTNNYALCNLTDEFTVEEGVKGESMSCTHYLYTVTGYVGLLTCGMFALGAYQMRNWKQNISLDGL